MNTITEKPNYMSKAMLEIKLIAAEDTYDIRKKVLRENIPLPVEFKGDQDDDTFHIGVYKDGVLVAISSFMKADFDKFEGVQYQLRGMATLDASRGLGAGRLMMEKAFKILAERNVDYLWCNARIVALDFYRKMGLKTFGELFTLAHVGDHYIMFKKIK